VAPWAELATDQGFFRLDWTNHRGADAAQGQPRFLDDPPRPGADQCGQADHGNGQGIAPADFLEVLNLKALGQGDANFRSGFQPGPATRSGPGRE
jgi:hypothetical protein